MKKALIIIGALLLPAIIIPVAYLIFRPNLILSSEEVRSEILSPTSRFVKWKGADVHYTDEGTGQTLLMIHGFGGNFRNFRKLNDSLRGAYRLIRVDLPGFGLSDFPATDYENVDFVNDYTEFFNFFMDTLRLDSIYVAGNSMGGSVAWMLAARRPDKVRKLVLITAAGYDMKKIAGGLFTVKFKAFDRMFAKGTPLFMSRMFARTAYFNHDMIDSAETVINNHIANRRGNTEHLFAMARSTRFPDEELIKTVECPTLILWGKEDKIVPVAHAHRFHKDIPGSRVLIYENCGHVPMLEMPSETYRDVKGFLAE